MIAKLIVCCMVLLSLFNVGIAKPSSGKVMKEDLPYISCETCQRAAKAIFTQITEAKKSTTTKKTLDELTITEVIEQTINPKHDRGEWLRQLDIAHSLDKGKMYLVLEEPGGVADCKDECATIAESVRRLINEDIDMDDLISTLWKGKYTEKTLQEKLCSKWTKRCVGANARRSLLTSYKRADQPFKAMDPKDLEMEQMLENMRAAGINGMNMYSRDDMASMVGDLDDEDEEESEGGNANFGDIPPN